jgi:RimJ/RimL family protein N-acetyltransferase
MTALVDRGRGVRLRTASRDEYVRLALPWYQDPEVLKFSEGGEPPYDAARVGRMYDMLSDKGELYLIEVREDAGWRVVGDAALLPDDLPIVIGRPEDRERGFGGEVLQLLLLRARESGRTQLLTAGIHPDNVRSLRMFGRAGFIARPGPDGFMVMKLDRAREP